MPTNTAPLTVYKASAGSGKTFTLAVEYIRLLVADPMNYCYTLAVTFTNKATQEMKLRILSKLYGIANSLPDADDYYKKVKKSFPNLTERVIRNRAGDALSLLVHDYSRFRVETIDSFFQRVLRNLARELGLTASLKVMLNDKEVESQAVDNIISNVDNGKDPLLTWIMDFISERMEEDKNWNVVANIKDFGQNIFSDFYKSHQGQLRLIMDDADFFKRYTSRLRALRAKALDEMADFAKRYDAIASEYGIDDSCYSRGHSNAPGYFENLAKGILVSDKPKMPNSYVLAGLEDPDKFVKKADVGKPVSIAIREHVKPLIEEAEEKREAAAVTVNSVTLTLQNINQLRLLGRIEKEVNRINADNNDYPLSNTQKLLNDLIDKQDSPFIYEKIGGQLRYIMIDEFQDTSTVQWANFKVLLDDCISHQAGSLIVGDVKQSIYRWRNGDWQLLQGLNETNYPGTVHVESLDTNYRSQRNVVDFNNCFFKAAKSTLSVDAPIIEKAYSDVVQEVPDSKPEAGKVVVKLLPSNDYDDLMISQVGQIIESLLSNGVQCGDIAIIVRKNKHIRLIADYFLHNPVLVDGEPRLLKMVSDEAFRLDASQAVNTIVNAMRYLANPDDGLTEAFLAKSFAGKELEPSDVARETGPDAKPSAPRHAYMPMLPPEFVASRAELLSMPLIDLAERLYGLFRLDRLCDQNAYVCAFFDHLSGYLKRRVAGITDFLEEWDESLCSKSIHSTEVNGIRLLTVHKSKGLEFDNVILPYCDWALETSNDTLWVEPSVEPYSDLPVVPVKLNAKKLKTSIYAADYDAEHIKNIVDNVNILYVAFTRASRNLFVLGKADKADFPSSLIASVVPNLPNAKPEKDADGIIGYSFGSLAFKPVEESGNHAGECQPRVNIFEQTEQGVAINIETTKSRAHFLQSNDSDEFMTPADELDERRKRDQYIDTGNIIHRLFSTIHDYTEVDAAIDQMEFDGVLYDRPMTRAQLKEFIEEKLRDPRVNDWFSPRWKAFNECSMIYFDPEEQRVKEQRPDRVVYDGKKMVVIDFKTGRELEKHKRQVRGYVHLLRDMGYHEVEGYLWYIRTGDMVKV